MNRRNFLVSGAIFAAGSTCRSGLGFGIGTTQKDDGAFQARSNSVMWDYDRWKPWAVDLAHDDVTHLTGYNAELSGTVRLTSAADVEPRKTPYGFMGPDD